MKRTPLLLCGLAVVLLLGSVSYADYASVVTGQNPLEYYRLDTLTGINSDTLTLNSAEINMTTPTPVLNSTTFTGFDAGNTWAVLDGSPGDTLTSVKTGWDSDAGSISYWIRVASTLGTGTGLIGRDVGGTGSFTGTGNSMIATFQRGDGSMGIKIDNFQTDVAAGTFSADTWHHLSFTWDRNTGAGDGVIRLYVDGSDVGGTTAGTWDSFTIADAARFGKELVGTRYFIGSADELAIWDRTLSAGEVDAQYTAAIVPEPATMSLLALGGIAMLRRRKK